jgi:hypothetical protein
MSLLPIQIPYSVMKSRDHAAGERTEIGITIFILLVTFFNLRLGKLVHFRIMAFEVSDVLSRILV